MWPIGHQRALDILTSSIKQEKLPHALLFSGPSQIGKKTLVYTIAQMLNCTASDKPCFECEACRRILSGNFADVSLIDMYSLDEAGSGQKQRFEISIEQIREMQHSVSLPPYEGKCKIYIIDDAEKMSVSAANCMLKTLEEPNDNNYFFLITSNEDKILPTVVSRCQKLNLKPVPYEDIKNTLKDKYGADEDRAELITGWSNGRIGWAINAALDEKVAQKRVERLGAICEAINGSLEQRFKYSTALSEKWAKDKEEVFNEIRLWQDLFRDISLHKNGLREEIINKDREEQISAIADGVSLRSIKKTIEMMLEVSNALRANASVKMALDMMMLSLPRNREEHAQV